MFIPLGQGVALKVALLPRVLVRLLLTLSLGPTESDPILAGCRISRLTGPRLARPVKIDHVAQRLPHLAVGFLRADGR